MKSILKWLLGLSGNSSGDTATNRMKVMLINDRYQMPPAIVEQMKQELLAVTSKYFEVDTDSAECVIKSQGNRRAFISAVVPLLKRSEDDAPTSTSKKRKTRKSKKENSADLSTAAA